MIDTMETNTRTVQLPAGQVLLDRRDFGADLLAGLTEMLRTGAFSDGFVQLDRDDCTEVLLIYRGGLHSAARYSGGEAGPLSLGELFTSGAWNAALGLTQPLFDAGRNRSRVAQAEAMAQESSLAWQASVIDAFREVADALVGYQRQREVRATQEALVVAATDARRLAELRYNGGATSYLEVLTNETNLFAAQRGLAQAHLGERLALVQLYKALGGGWQ